MWLQAIPGDIICTDYADIEKAILENQVKFLINLQNKVTVISRDNTVRENMHI